MRRCRGVIGFGGTGRKTGNRLFFGRDSGNPGNNNIGIYNRGIGNNGIKNSGIIIIICVYDDCSGGSNEKLIMISSEC